MRASTGPPQRWGNFPHGRGKAQDGRALIGLRLVGELEQAIEDLAEVDYVQQQPEVAG
jgi:hypothetical protein